MKRWLLLTPLLGSCVFQGWSVDGKLYACGGGCPDELVCDDGVCCAVNGAPACPTRVPDGGQCADGGAPITFYADQDLDTFGDQNVTRQACSKPLTEPWVEDDTDCDDTSAAAHPGGTEVCDGHDNDCNGAIDEGQSPLQAYYRDVDGDHFGAADAGVLMACACPNDTCVPTGYAPTAGDCAPNDNARHPGAPELCNGLDDDCNNQNDDNVTVGVGASCADAGLGECNAGTTACVAGRVSCKPNKTASKDLCDGLDNNCNGMTDEQPDCGGPNQLLVGSVAVIGARDTGIDTGLQMPTTCLKGMGTAGTVSGVTWSGNGTNYHVWYAEAPAGTTWDLSKPGLKFHLQFTTSMVRQNATSPWNQFAQPFVLVCNTTATRLSRYRPYNNGQPNESLMQTASQTVNTNMPFGAAGADAGWLIAAPGADLTQVKRIEIVLQPRDNGTMVPAFTATFNPNTGFKP
ncbi:MAG: putative metal-binding motif-containing protein [Archangiaceae bacterium]|nr:putative metal-binding motif-containing protein [Archangiaceae bacterium]